MLYCVLKLCTVICTLRWAVRTVFWIEFCHTGPISLCIDLFAFISLYFVCFCFILHSCCIIVSMVGWTWWDWTRSLGPCLPSVLWHCWLGHLTCKKPVPDLTYNVFGGTLNLALSISTSNMIRLRHDTFWYTCTVQMVITHLPTSIQAPFWHPQGGYCAVAFVYGRGNSSQNFGQTLGWLHFPNAKTHTCV